MADTEPGADPDGDRRSIVFAQTQVGVETCKVIRTCRS